MLPAPSQSADVQAHVERLLASPNFRIPPRRERLLRYLAVRVAAGEGDRINEYAIGVDVFDRPESFDPKTDAVVRAEIRRLRQSLCEYYSKNGSAGDLILELPARSYVPILRAAVPASEIVSGEAPPIHLHRGWIWLAAGLVIAFAAVWGWRWLAPKAAEPPPFALAVLPATVEPSAADLADRADTVSQEIATALWRTRGLSVLDWMKVSGFRGTNAVREARARLPVSLILETRMARAAGTLRAEFRLYGRRRESAIWSASVPLESVNNLESSVGALAAANVSPVLERNFNILSYRQSTGRTRIQPSLAGLAPVENPCAKASRWLDGIGQPPSQVTVGAQALDALSQDTRIEIFANGQRAYPSTTVRTRAGTPISLRAPAIADLAEDTCVLNSSYGDAPVYGESCIVTPPGVADVRLIYTCAPKTKPIDISRLANDANLWNEETFPSGPRILGGVPFLIPDGLNRFHDAGGDMRGARPVTVTIQVNRPSVSKAFFLMNTVWGESGPASYLSLTFHGDRGAQFEKKLIGGVDVRDYNRGTYTNTIDGIHTRPAFDDGLGQRIDLVEVDLPAEFQQQTLQTIAVTDTGRWSFERAVFWAVSVR